MNAILTAEDNELNLRLFHDLLSAYGHRVELASSGVEALRKARCTPYRLILMDMRLAGLSGLEVMRQLKGDSDWPRAPILAVSASAVQGEEVALLAAGFDGYLSKPVALDGLLETVTRHLYGDCLTRRGGYLNN